MTLSQRLPAKFLRILNEIIKGKKDYDELMEKKNFVDKKTHLEENELLQHFSTLEKALKKYKRISLNEKLIDAYLENPSKALMEDEGFQVIDILDKMKASLDKLNLKDKKAEKTVEEINRLSKEFLEGKKGLLERLSEEKKRLEEELEGSKVLEDLDEEEQKLALLRKRTNEQEALVEELKEKTKKGKPEKIKKNIKELLEELSVELEG